MPRSILVVDDHVMFREGLKLLLEGGGKYRVVGEAGDGIQAIEMVATVHPDFVVMDLAMPGLDGIAAISRIAGTDGAPLFVALSSHDETQLVRDALHAGAAAFVLKENAFRELLLALERIGSGHRYLSPKLEDLLIRGFLDADERDGPSEAAGLSSREREIVALLCAGKATKEIAFDLGLSPKTVDVHRKNIFEKLGVSSTVELVKYAIKTGLVLE